MIYIHVPFCRSFCTYCDFYSEIACKGKDAQAIAAYLGTLRAEARRRTEEIEATRGTDTLYIGGGTPSVLPPDDLRSIVEAVGGPPSGEFTVEVNPEDIAEKGPGYAAALRNLGVNRISMGVQSLDDGMLRFMNRRHDAAGARLAFRLLREAGFGNISVDLIFGIGGLSDRTLELSAREIVSWRPEHISAYQLSIEPGSALASLAARGEYVPASDEVCAGQYAMLCSLFAGAGYTHYEISNWALPGREAVHNSAYWSRKPYAGLGPGAHSFDGILRSWNSARPDAWTQDGCESLSPEEEREETIMLALRTAQGIDRAYIESASAYAGPLLRRGTLSLTAEGRVRIPEDKFFVSDEIIAELL